MNEVELGVYSISDSGFKKHERIFKTREVCETCSKGDGDEGVQDLLKCNGCSAVFYCSKQCQVAAWPEHKAFCRSSESFSEMHELFTHFYEHPGLLHHLRVALILKLGLHRNPSPDECWNVQLQLQLYPANKDDGLCLYTGPYADVDESASMQGHLRTFRIAVKGKLNLGIPLSKLSPAGSIIVRMWKRARKQVTAAGRKDNPIVMVDIEHDEQEFSLGVEITKEAFLTALGMATPSPFALPLSEELKRKELSCERVLVQINTYIEEDEDNKLGLRKEMRECDKEVVRNMGREMKRRRD